MATAKHAHEAARAKAAKEKKILLALAPVLLIAGFFAYHTMSKLHSSGSVTSPPPTTPASTVSTGTPVSATTPVAPPTLTPPATSGKLSSLPGFAPKDPFHDQGPHAAASSSGSGSGSSKSSKGGGAKLSVAAAPPTTAVIAVNGHLGTIAVGSIFPLTKDPATNGIFKLVSLTAKSAKVSVVGGSYTSGAHVLTLAVNSVVRLVNTADGKRYTLIRYPQGTVVAGAASTSSSGSTATTTTSTTTTTSGP